MIPKLHNIFLDSTGVNTDTRKIVKGNLFFALTGENFDGNLYVEKALENGAMHVVTSNIKWKNNSKATVVEDVLLCLQQLATFHRNYINIPIIALTGSNGKTTTKELILSVLSTKLRVKGTKGNLNNHIGVPLTLLSFDNSLHVGIIEMGANHPKEIEALCDIAQPNFGLITNYGKAHLEGFGSIEGVKTSKSELYTYLKQNKRTVIIGRWDPEQIVRSLGIKQVLTPENTSVYSETPYLTFITDGELIKTNLTGTYNYHNALFAYTVGVLMDIDKADIVKGLSNYIPSNNRSQIIKNGKTKIILDAYNANPSSMKVALENLEIQEAPYKLAILGDMFELGKYAEEEHQKIATFAEKLMINEVILIGENFCKTKVQRSKQYKNKECFNESFTLNTDKEQTILLKGSRGIGLESILEQKGFRK
ncbi:MAG: UDP-N-acetylmuramoyl-tripeptide--D-alanyl-D-alanine ligase [Nonlabens sp.]|uniref:UDP-N-acetylmuramoyl-tripeptide--D-alanyl-D- alanine ligase n=1 Tax=Nonlabens sp. TaxID=1888209 RepID=UPI00321BA34F